MTVFVVAGCAATTAPASPHITETPSAHSSAPPETPPAVSEPRQWTAALTAWRDGADSDSAAMSGYFLRAATLLRAAISDRALALSATQRAAYARAAAQLVDVASIPDTGVTKAEAQREDRDIDAINAFFGTDGLYGESAPSLTTGDFLATLQLEVRVGTLDSDTTTAAGPATLPAMPAATVTCPYLRAVAAGTVFACEIRAPGKLTCPRVSKSRSLFFVPPTCVVGKPPAATIDVAGTIETADATTYESTFEPHGVAFDCSGTAFPGPPPAAALTALGASC